MTSNHNFKTISTRIPSALFDAINAEVVTHRRSTGKNSSVSSFVRDVIANQFNSKGARTQANYLRQDTKS